MRADIANRIVAEQIGRPDATYYSWEALHLDRDGIDGIRIKYADVPTVKTGPRAGKPNWRKMTNQGVRIITTEEYNQWVAAWVAEGNCENCNNTGEVFVRWHHTEGTTMKPCGKCDRTAPEPEPIGGLFA